jgi:hypothetical protein
MNKPAQPRGFQGFFATTWRIGGLFAAVLAVVSCDDGSKNRHPGQTEFTSKDNGSGSGSPGRGLADSASAGATAPTTATPAAPSGRTGTVQEADIYRLSGTRLFYLNTYRGFMVYDVSNSQQPVKVSALPIFGYPVEMFVEGNTVYALLRDALYLTEVGGQFQFQRHYVSQLVTIDVSDLAHPRVLKTLDIIGELHEGVSRKIDDTIYVVSEQFGGYYWGWVTPDVVPTEQAWVYSYDVSDPQNPRQAGQLQIFEGGNTQDQSSSRYFSGVAISATANALMVVENWNTWGSGIGPCGWGNDQQAVVSVFDISDPTGNIRLHTHFSTGGSLDDQFKMTYRFDDATKRGTFFGIFGRQSWSSCGAGAVTQNTLESWDITDGAAPQRLASLDFGKPGEAVRGTAFDLTRNVAYAITARQVDPLYAIDITDPAAPRVASAIDGLSGSVSVFRTVAGGQFLLGVGTDTSSACDGAPDPNTGWANTKMALTIVDVRDLGNIRLVQRQCIAIQNAEWTWSSLNWNLDQAHKMLGMFQDGDLNVLTVPVSYYTRQDANVDVGWWYQWKTAVGLLTWDLSRYDPSKPPEQQTVVRSYGTFVHPEGEVNRSILFRHPSTGARTMINLSDTHLSVANIDDLAQPRLESIVEVAPPVNEIFGFGNYVVERVDLGQGYWSQNGMAEFRVKRAGGDVDDKAPVATFRIGQATAAYPYKNNLVVLRYQIDDPNNPSTSTTTEAIVYDLSDPTRPRLASRLTVPFQSFRYWGFFCGVDFWGGYWFGGGSDTIVTDTGLVQLRTDYQWNGSQTVYQPSLALLDLRNPAAPAVDQVALDPRTNWSWFTLVSDPAAPAGFYLSRRDYLGQETADGGGVFSLYRDFAQRWESGGGHLVAGADINIPGPLARTWVDRGTRLFLTNENIYRTIQFPDHTDWHGDTRLNLLRQTGSAAELLDDHTFVDLNVSSLIVDGAHLFVAAQRQYYWWGYADLRAASPPTWESTSDRLMTFDLGGRTLRSIFDQPIRTNYSQLMGLHGQHLFLNLAGDGVLLIDVADPAHPSGVRFVRTLGWASHIDFVGNDGYVAAGNFGSFDIDLAAAPALASD